MTYAERNSQLIYDCYHAESKLRSAWGWGDPRAGERLRKFADWLEDIWLEIDDLNDDGALSDRAEKAALNACTDLLDLDYIPCGDFLKYIVRIRNCLRPGIGWTDYPYDVTGLEDTSEESSDDGMMFEMDDP
ncbi:hypothetical protein CI109_101670 [Kwoniella shandongensis]|uniref:Uncharacterized protein n=1 Tax=Kwoniella shandongensis TaxID=1734106 RepID=A0A5M6C5W5_9TREE|nr:uncharacterized protein CI109_001206 [Kwoniella shandongensis]KAA5530403.1 hypothetical protein CI109_001206 [Kwoniella shandongensis]